MPSTRSRPLHARTLARPVAVLLAALLAASAALRAQQPPDPAPLRLALLQQMDARIHAAAARAHLEARLMLDETLPIAFLGMVAEQDAGRGLPVTQVYRKSGAEAAGLSVGDRILAFAGTPTETRQELYVAIRRHRPGEQVDLLIVRDGTERLLRPVLGKRWEEDEEDVEQYADIPLPPFVAQGLPAALDFEGDAPGTLPATLHAALGGTGNAPDWTVVRDGDGAVLRQAAPDGLGLHFPMALVTGVDADDVVARVRFRLVDGAQDRCAGLMLHWQDENNYLVARANAVEGDLRLFRTVDGLRRTLPGGVAQLSGEASIDDDAWHLLEFRAEGPKLTAVLDGKVTVSSYDTFFLHGGVGLWTKADAVTDFDGLDLSRPGP